MNVSDFSSSLRYDDGTLWIEDCAVDLIAEEFSTPLFIYSSAHIKEQHAKLANAIAGTNCHIYYAVKANSNLSILRLFKDLGVGFDVVSGGELKRVLMAGGAAKDVMFSGVGKTRAELFEAISQGIGSINIESPAEVELCAVIAEELNTTARILVRVNPNVDAQTHPYISTGLKENKFGLSEEDAFSALEFAHNHPRLEALGIACHIGSQLVNASPFNDALSFMVSFYRRLESKGIKVPKVDLGGGLGIRYEADSAEVELEQYADVIKTGRQLLPNVDLSIEPGRFLVGNAGIFVSTVLDTKHNGDKNFVIVDGAMNDVIRPALYQAEQVIINTKERTAPAKIVDVVGPICESTDFLAKNRALSVKTGDYLALLSSGAYCACMGSNYNTRLRAAEILVDGGNRHVISRRETFEELIAREIV